MKIWEIGANIERLAKRKTSREFNLYIRAK